MAKESKLLEDVLPYETEAQINLVAKTANSIFIRRGNLITPDSVISIQVNFSPSWIGRLLLNSIPKIQLVFIVYL